MQIKYYLSVLLTVLSISAFAQEELSPMDILEQNVETLNDAMAQEKALKISGYFQPQWQFGDEAASLKVGKENKEGGAYDRFGIRRGRIKFAYSSGIASGVFQLNISDKEGLKGASVSIKEAYVELKDPFVNTNKLTAGVMNRPFGHEISYSSSSLESPERSRVISTLFPEECDLGTMVTLQPAKTSDYNFLKFEGGLFAGNAINPETDSRKDFIGHLSATKSIGSSARWGAGVSYYNGGAFQSTENVYTILGDAFVLNNAATNKGGFAKREYFGVDAQLSVETPAGMTQIRAEWVGGTQPGTIASSSSPNRSALPTADDTYLRSVNGWYAILVQDLGSLPVSAVLKYELYDPNSAVAGDRIGAAASTGSADIQYTTLGVGAFWRVNSNVRLSAHYELTTNELTANVSKYMQDLKDNVLTVRLQYKF